MRGREQETHTLIIHCTATGAIVSVRQEINHRKKMIRFSPPPHTHTLEGEGAGGERPGGMQETKAQARNIWLGSRAHTFLMYRRGGVGGLGRVPTVSRSCLGRKTDDSGTRPTHIPPSIRQADLVPIARVTHALRSM